MKKIIFSILCLAASSCSEQTGPVHITGTIDGSAENNVLIEPIEQPFPPKGDFIKVHIHGDTIDSHITLDSNTVYLVWVADYKRFGVASRKILFPDCAEVYVQYAKGTNMALNSDSKNGQLYDNYINARKNYFRGEIDNYYTIHDSLSRNDCIFSEQFKECLKQLENNPHSDSLISIRAELFQSGDYLTPEGKMLDSMNRAINILKLDYDKENLPAVPKSLASFLLTVENLEKSFDNKYDFLYWKKYYETEYKDSFKECNLHLIAENFLTANHLTEGQSYIDFTLPDENGLPVSLSSQIDGKLAIIDFWSSTCRPCILNSRQLMPLYEKYKDSGFTVVGLARETTENGWHKSLARNDFKWKNLIALPENHYLWYLYGLSNETGKTFLVDKDGTILKINPSVEEIETAILESISYQ